MKKTIATLLAMIMIVSVGCGNDSRGENENTSALSESDNIVEQKPKVKIADFVSMGRFYYTNLSSATGIQVSNETITWDDMIVKLMAQDTDIDIMLVPYYYFTQLLEDKGIYYKMNDSDIICNYIDNCFDYISDGAKLENGDIGFFPVSSYLPIMFYPDGVLDEFGVTENDLYYFDDFMATAEKVKNSGKDKRFYCHANSLYEILVAQYEHYYCDFENNEINYETDIFRHIYETLLTGWIRHQQQPQEHPLFTNEMALDRTWSTIFESPQYNTETTFISWISVDYMYENCLSLAEDKWRAVALPKISDKIENNIANLTCAVINPKSPNIEQAIKVLEAVAENPEDMINGNPFLLKDKSLYGEKYYSNTRAFEDIYSIASECVLMNSGIGSSFPDIDEYQNGRATLDEAIAMYQREVEMWLNE